MIRLIILYSTLLIHLNYALPLIEHQRLTDFPLSKEQVERRCMEIMKLLRNDFSVRDRPKGGALRWAQTFADNAQFEAPTNGKGKIIGGPTTILEYLHNFTALYDANWSTVVDGNMIVNGMTCSFPRETTARCHHNCELNYPSYQFIEIDAQGQVVRWMETYDAIHFLFLWDQCHEDHHEYHEKRKETLKEWGHHHEDL